MEETWKPVPFTPFDEKYSISNFGRVKPNRVSRYSPNGAEVLKLTKHHKGYLCVTLYADGKAKWTFVHNMVALAFLDPAPDGKTKVLHKDDNPENNRADNLYWGDAYENYLDAAKNNGHDNKRTRNGHAKLSESDIAEIRRLYSLGSVSQVALADRFHIDQTQISRIVRKQHWPDKKTA